jgi:hypothetical protein
MTIQLAAALSAPADIVDDVVVQPDDAADTDLSGGVDEEQQRTRKPQVAGQGDDERGQSQSGDDEALKRSVGGGRPQAAQDRDPPGVVQRQQPQRDDRAARGGEAGRQVDLAEQQDEDLGHAERDDERGLGHQVDQVARGQEQRALDLEEDHDDDQADDDRQRAALPAADPLQPDPQVLTDRPGQQFGRGP